MKHKKTPNLDVFQVVIFTQQHVWKLPHEYLSLYQACYAKMGTTDPSEGIGTN